MPHNDEAAFEKTVKVSVQHAHSGCRCGIVPRPHKLIKDVSRQIDNARRPLPQQGMRKLLDPTFTLPCP